MNADASLPLQVIVSVGGDPTSGGNWDKLNPQGIANFCNDFGLDGVDLDFETTPTGCPGACSTDASYINAIVKMRAFLAPHLLITTAPASVGSYGEAFIVHTKDPDPHEISQYLAS